MKLDVTRLQEEAHENSRAHGFWDDAPDGEDGGRWDEQAMRSYLGNKLMLVVGEVAEAHEELRKPQLIGQAYYTQVSTTKADGDVVTHDKPEGLPSELADVVIRVADLAEYLGISLEQAIREKVAYNRTRPMRHGKVM